jgi:hypothetical protein
MSGIGGAAPGMVQPTAGSGHGPRTAATSFPGTKAGLRAASLRANDAGWPCTASRGAGDGEKVRQ